LVGVKFYFLSVTPLPLPDKPFLHGNGGFSAFFWGLLARELDFRGFLGAYYTNLEKVKETVSRKSTIQFLEQKERRKKNE